MLQELELGGDVGLVSLCQKLLLNCHRVCLDFGGTFKIFILDSFINSTLLLFE